MILVVVSDRRPINRFLSQVLNEAPMAVDHLPFEDEKSARAAVKNVQNVCASWNNQATQRVSLGNLFVSLKLVSLKSS